MSVQLPRLLDANLQEIARLHPSAASLTLSSPGTSQAQITIPPGEPQPVMHQWMELFTPRGSAGYFRVINTVTTYTGETQVNLRHAVDTFADSVYDAQADEATYTVSAFLAAVLAKQTARVNGSAPWQLGTVEDTTSLKRALNYDKLSELLNGVEEEKYQFAFTYDFTTWPWTLSFVRKPDTVASEFRLSRNIDSLQVTLNDAELCTQLILSVNVTTTTTPAPDPDNTWPSTTSTESTVRVYNNLAAQARWGVVQKTASIDTQDDIAGQSFPDADAWAARYLQDREDPTLQIQIDGEDLYEYTFDRYDEADLGKLCRVSLPDYSAFFSERVVAVQYNDLYGAPNHITVSLANRLPRVTNSISATQKEASSASASAATAKRASGAGGGGGGGAAKELEAWSMIVKKTKEAEDATGITEMHESGILLDAETGVRLYSMAQGFQSQYAELTIHNNKIALVVQETNPGTYEVKSASIVAAINNSVSSVMINADKIILNGATLAARMTSAEASILSITSDNMSTEYLSAQNIKCMTFNFNSYPLHLQSVTIGGHQYALLGYQIS